MRVYSAAILCAGPFHAHSQLIITPSPAIHTVAGTDSAGYAGDNGPALTAKLRSPRAIARDAAGNIYIADAGNHVIRRIDSDGIITTVAGSGKQGFYGDGAAATSAELNTPSSIVVAPDGTLYIADTMNHRVRKVDTKGIITTIAGSGTFNTLGDNGPATIASLRKPVALTLDKSGNFYIADAADFRVRSVDINGIIHTIAGTGAQGSNGDGGPAINAELDAPSALAFDTAGQLFIGDRRNGRVRVIRVDGTIETVVSSKGDTGNPGFVRPDGIAISTDGSLYIADAVHQKVFRQISKTFWAEIGNGEQALSADGHTLTTASLDRPAAVMVDASDSVFLVERGGKVSTLTPAFLRFGSTSVGSSMQQDLQFANAGSIALTITNAILPQSFMLLTGNCGPLPIHLAAGQSCKTQIKFAPTSIGVFTGTGTFSGGDFLPQSVQLSAQSIASTKTATTTALETDPIMYAGQPLTITATVYTSGAGIPTGDITFIENNISLGSSALRNNKAQWIIASPTVGAHAFLASYSGDASFAASTSAQTITSISAGPPDFVLSTGNSSTTSLTVAAGAPALFQFQIIPTNGSYGQTVTFSAQGVPAGVTVAFDPPAVIPGSNPQTILMTIKVVQTASHTLAALSMIGFCCILPWMFRRKRYSLLSISFLMFFAGCASRPPAQSTPSKGGITQKATIVATAVSPSGTSVTKTIDLLITVK
ncbi:MAG: Ig-like domain repeat protein [Acidobacteria bacterium]|nr:Ig-like domain repeat protein [Acidobacteriota bacterium]